LAAARCIVWSRRNPNNYYVMFEIWNIYPFIFNTKSSDKSLFFNVWNQSWICNDLPKYLPGLNVNYWNNSWPADILFFFYCDVAIFKQTYVKQKTFRSLVQTLKLGFCNTYKMTEKWCKMTIIFNVYHTFISAIIDNSFYKVLHWTSRKIMLK